LRETALRIERVDDYFAVLDGFKNLILNLFKARKHEGK